MRSKRFEALDARPVSQDGYVTEWPEVGLIAMNSPSDPTPSIRIEGGVVVELDGKRREDFDMIDTFIADYGIRLDNAVEVNATPSLELARRMVDFTVPREEVVKLTTAMTPAKMVEVVGTMNVLEMMMAVTKMRSRLFPANQAHVTNLDSSPYLGRLALCRVVEGTVSRGQTVAWCRRDGSVQNVRLSELLMTEALDRVSVEQAGPGDIIAIAGIPEITIGETLSDPADPRPLPLISVDEPSISMTIGIKSGIFGSFLRCSLP